MVKKLITICLSAFVFAVFATDGRTTILFTNDTHTHIDDGNISYAQIANYRDALREKDEHVILVDTGDFVQGSAFGKIDRGTSLVGIMNTVGYQVATIGNHEIDYGMDCLLQTARTRCQFPIVVCNFWKTNLVSGTRESVFPPYTVITSGTTRVAFVGVATPETLTFSSPRNFLDPTGTYKLYDFDDGQALCDNVQHAVNEAARQSDAVVVLSHLGLGEPGEPLKSPDLIARTTNFIALIDGHSHHAIAGSNILNAAGHPVRLVQSGSYLKALGRLTIENGAVVGSDLVTSLGPSDPAVRDKESELIAKVNAWLGKKLAICDVTLHCHGRSRDEAGETNLGDFSSDAFWWFANAYSKNGCDLALCNYGGLRNNVTPGDFTLRTANDVCPFGNGICIIEMSGEQLRDALEWGTRKMPSYLGGFLHCAGLRFAVITSRSSTVKSERNIWTSGPTNGVYRVEDIEVYDRKAKKFVRLDLSKIYRVAGCDFILRNCGEGFNMFKKCKVVEDSLQLDYLVLASYAKAFVRDKDSWPHLRASASPLANLPGYPINYASPTGSRRIVRRVATSSVQ